MKHLFILNPVAGKGKTLRLLPEIKDYFKGRNEEYIIETTRYPGHATEIAAAYSAKDTYRIYSVGGDGTLNEVLNGMAGSSSSLADIPSGSGNDFVKSILGSLVLKDVIKQTVEAEEQLVDFARVNNKYFINIASIGFDAQVVHKTGNYKKIPLITGKMAYMLGVFTTILKCSNQLLEITIDDVFVKQTKTVLIAVGNGRYYGGGMLPVPNAKIDDGQFDLCQVDAMSRLNILRLFPKYIKGLHGSIKQVHFYKGRKVCIRAAAPMIMNIDGEVAIVDEAVFEIIPKGISFIVPR
jgi:YegS/Rv2252/BmrU family lipid kinase